MKKIKLEKPKFTLWQEFKAFINKGSVLDLAVGMIIGGAFTAIVSALVNNILKPLINWIPISKEGTGLQTILREAVVSEDGTVITQALILDWGAVISAIITFLLTAVVLFAVIKAINTAKRISEDAKKEIEKDVKKLTKNEEGAPTDAAPVEEAPVEVAPPEVNKTEQLLEEILAELKSQKQTSDK